MPVEPKFVHMTSDYKIQIVPGLAWHGIAWHGLARSENDGPLARAQRDVAFLKIATTFPKYLVEPELVEF
jgi:hypothetical protein